MKVRVGAATKNVVKTMCSTIFILDIPNADKMTAKELDAECVRKIECKDYEDRDDEDTYAKDVISTSAHVEEVEILGDDY